MTSPLATLHTPGRTRIGALLVLYLGSIGCDRAGGPSEEVASLRNKARLLAAPGRSAPEDRAELLQTLKTLAERPSATEPDWLNFARAELFGPGRDDPGGSLELLGLVERHSRRAGERSPALSYLLGVAANRSGDTARAESYFEDVARVDPSSRAAVYQLGVVQLASRKYADAIETLMRVAGEDDYLGAAALYKISQAHRRAGRDDERKRFRRSFEARKESLPSPFPGEDAFERCGYTELELPAPARRRSEPPRVRIALRRDADTPALDGLERSRLLDVLDLDGDGEPEALSLDKGAIRLLRLTGPEAPQPELSILGDAGSTPRVRAVIESPGRVSCAAADFDADRRIDLFLFERGGPGCLLRSQGDLVFEPLRVRALERGDRLLDARWLDIDLDGWLDLVLFVESDTALGRRWSVRVGRNDRASSLVFPEEEGRVNVAETLAPIEMDAPGAVRIAWADFDSRRGAELALPGADGAHLWTRRSSPPEFRRQVISGLAGHAVLVAADLDNDGDADLAGAPTASLPLSIAWNDGVGDTAAGGELSFRVEAFGRPRERGETLDVAVADLDNDGDSDLSVLSTSGLDVSQNRAGGGFALERVPADEGRCEDGALRSIDLDGDGALDFVIWRRTAGSTNSNLWEFLANSTRSPYGSLRLRLRRRRQVAIGTRVELYAGRSFQAFEVRRPGDLHLGLGCRAESLETVDGLRVIWPHGAAQSVLQRELRLDTRRTVVIIEQ